MVGLAGFSRYLLELASNAILGFLSSHDSLGQEYINEIGHDSWSMNHFYRDRLPFDGPLTSDNILV